MTNTIFTRHGFAATLRTMRDTLAVASCAMVRYQFDAPWKARRPTC